MYCLRFVKCIAKYLVSLLLTISLLESATTAVEFIQGHYLMVSEGNPLKLECISNDKDITFKKSDFDLEGSSFLSGVMEEDGQYVRTFYKEEAILGDEALYQCEIPDESTIIEVVISPNLPATLEPANGILEQPENVDFTLICKPEEYDSQIPTFTWIQMQTSEEDIDLNECAQDTTKPECCLGEKADDCKYLISTNGSLVVLAAKYNDSGQYVCRIFNPTDTNKYFEYPFSVTVYKEIAIEAPQSVTFIEGSDAHLECSVEGFPFPNITWLKEDQVVVESNTIKFNLDDTDINTTTTVIHSISIDNVVMSQRAEYTCLAENQFEKTEKTILLRVKDRYAALWPFLGIVAEVLVLCAIILIYEKRSKDMSGDEEDEEEEEEEDNPNNPGVDDIRHRNIKT